MEPVKIFGKEGCNRCETAKQHLGDMGIKYEYHTLQHHTQLHDGWREDGSVELMAYVCTQHPDQVLPVIHIGGAYVNYAQGMRRAKEAAHRGKRAESGGASGLPCQDRGAVGAHTQGHRQGRVGEARQDRALVGVG